VCGSLGFGSSLNKCQLHHVVQTNNSLYRHKMSQSHDEEQSDTGSKNSKQRLPRHDLFILNQCNPLNSATFAKPTSTPRGAL
jgi:hypothetical protein